MRFVEIVRDNRRHRQRGYQQMTFMPKSDRCRSENVTSEKPLPENRFQTRIYDTQFNFETRVANTTWPLLVTLSARNDMSTVMRRRPHRSNLRIPKKTAINYSTAESCCSHISHLRHPFHHTNPKLISPTAFSRFVCHLRCDSVSTRIRFVFRIWKMKWKFFFLSCETISNWWLESSIRWWVAECSSSLSVFVQLLGRILVVRRLDGFSEMDFADGVEMRNASGAIMALNGAQWEWTGYPPSEREFSPPFECRNKTILRHPIAMCLHRLAWLSTTHSACRQIHRQPKTMKVTTEISQAKEINRVDKHRISFITKCHSKNRKAWNSVKFPFFLAFAIFSLSLCQSRHLNWHRRGADQSNCFDSENQSMRNKAKQRKIWSMEYRRWDEKERKVGGVVGPRRARSSTQKHWPIKWGVLPYSSIAYNIGQFCVSDTARFTPISPRTPPFTSIHLHPPSSASINLKINSQINKTFQYRNLIRAYVSKHQIHILLTKFIVRCGPTTHSAHKSNTNNGNILPSVIRFHERNNLDALHESWLVVHAKRKCFDSGTKLTPT